MNTSSEKPPGSASPYTFRPRTLARWAKANLTFTPTDEGNGGEAVFRFQGSTCGNIEFDLLYHIAVGPAAEGWPILSQRCEPASRAGGHTYMCCWREDADMVQKWMNDATPLVGKPLEAALSWYPIESASGCLCHTEGRLHKWNAALQALHYHLSQSNPPSSLHEN